MTKIICNKIYGELETQIITALCSNFSSKSVSNFSSKSVVSWT